MQAKIDIEAENKEIVKRYKGLIKDCRRSLTTDDKKRIRKAFDLAVDSHKHMRRKSGEPYIYHPIAVAHIAVSEIGLGATSVICGLLHDVVEDTEITLEDIDRMFGPKVTKIIDGLTKMSGVFDHTTSIQAENFRKMLLTLSDDVRVILIKLADRLHNMRTLDSMARDKQLKIASETLFLYAPLAHRLGLYAIKTELEDLSLKYTEPEIYSHIVQKLKDSEKERNKYIAQFNEPILNALNDAGFTYKLKGRVKSIHSIYNKMKKQNVPFEEVYDIFAIRIIIDCDTDKEKEMCWKAYSSVTDFYRPNPDRLRDWISIPKGNGYESLHTTVMGPQGKWVEVQIRSTRMDEIAEKGYAAHWKYKDNKDGVNNENKLDDWLTKIREMLESNDANAIDFIDDFKLNLFSEEIFLFTPKGELKTLPINSTALDFAFEVHSQIGSRCIGAKVNNRLVPLSHKLKSGDQVEILTSSKQSPKEDWLQYVTTAKAKSAIKQLLKEDKKRVAEDGRAIIERKLSHSKINISDKNIQKLIEHYSLPNSLELFYQVATGRVKIKNFNDFIVEKGNLEHKSQPKPDKNSLEQIVKDIRGGSGQLVIGEGINNIEYKFSPCCTPIPGDDVFGFITVNEGIKIHRTNCPNAIQLMSNYAYRIVKAKWTNQKMIAFLAGIKLTGIDDVGLVNNITKIISEELNVNMRSISFDSNDGVFEGNIMVFVHDTAHLDNLFDKLKKVSGVLNVTRIDNN
jgi:guanosine-3',5'-bis(diphosphate) 3'-pyrophosphohydrolase